MPSQYTLPLAFNDTATQDDIIFKLCNKCGTRKPIDEYPNQSKNRGGKHPHCKACRSEAGKLYWQANRVRLTERQRSRQYVHYRHHEIKKKYGLSKSEYERLTETHAGKCAICGNGNNGKILAVDHCHRTGVIRGMLCDGCNRGIGQMGDDPARLRLAASYLEKYR